MIDFQTIFIRDTADLQQINFIAVLRIEVEDTAGVQAVYVNGQEAKYIKGTNGRTLFAHLPDGVNQEQVFSVRVLRVRVLENAEEKDIETVFAGQNPLEPSQVIADPNRTDSPSRVRFFGGVLQLIGADFSTATRVKINNTDVPFTLVSNTEIMCSLPENATTIDRIDVITTSKTINRKTYFEYLVEPNPMAVMGMQKLIQQFVKLLLTTTGSDAFDPTLGGDLQQFVGTNFSPSNTSSLVAQVTLRVIQLGIQMTLRQSIANIPPNERLSDVQVLGVSIDPDDPTILSMSLRLSTFAGRSAQFDTMIGGALDYAQSAVATVTSTVSGSTGGY